MRGAVGNLVRAGKTGARRFDLKPKARGDKGMKLLGILAVISLFSWFGALPAAGQGCCHHDHHDGDCCDGDHCWHQGFSAGRPFRGSGLSSGTANVQTVEGKIAEVVYLPGATTDSGMVELRLQSGGQTNLIRLAPSGFLKQGGLVLREGDTVTVKGFAVAGMEGDLVVATEVHKGDKSLSLRDTRGQPAW